MEPLYDCGGQVYAWLQLQSGRIISRKGQHVAFLVGQNVYSWQAGTWDGGAMVT